MPIQLSDVPRCLLLVITPIAFSAIAAFLESQFQGDHPNTLAYVSFLIAIMMTLTTWLAVPRLKTRPIGTIFLGSLAAPFLAVLIMVLIPPQIYALNPIPHGYYRLIADVASMSVAYWATMSCVFILAFRPRLPIFIVGIVMVVALLIPPLSMLLVMDSNDLNDFARRVAFFSIFCTPAIPLGCLLTAYAPLLQNQQSIPSLDT